MSSFLRLLIHKYILETESKPVLIQESKATQDTAPEKSEGTSSYSDHIDSYCMDLYDDFFLDMEME